MNEVRTIISQLEHQKAAIERAISALREIETPPSGTTKTPSGVSHHKKRRLSAEGRKRIAEAARRRWAAVHARQAETAKKSGKKSK